MINNTGSETEPLSCPGVFNLAAQGYDGQALRYFPFAADRMVARLNPKPGSRILDVATGTGVVALAASQAVGATGRVMGIDLAEQMLARAEQKIRKFGIANVDLHVMDATHLDFRSAYFDFVTCGFALFLLPDMQAALGEWRRVLKPGGRLIFSSFGQHAFQPMVEVLLRQLSESGVESASDRPVAAERLSDPQKCRALLAAAGYADIIVESQQFGFHLKDASEWWEIVWSSGLRGPIERLPRADHARFQAAHLAEVAGLLAANDHWLDVEVLFSSGTRPQD